MTLLVVKGNADSLHSQPAKLNHLFDDVNTAVDSPAVS